MPDVALYLKAISAAAGASALCVLALGGVRRPAGAARSYAACILAIALGLALGGVLLRLPFGWPPASGLARLLEIVLPATAGIELLAGCERAPRWLAWTLRLILAALSGRILLHESAYLSGPHSEWTPWQATTILALCGGALAIVWLMLSRLSARSPGILVSLALAQTIACCGAAVMLAGYLAGGEAAIVLAAALGGAALASRSIGAGPAAQGMIGVGVVGLFGLLFVGRFFGRLSTGAALTMLFAPLLCWAAEWPPLERQKPWLKAALCLALVALPLAFVLAAAQLHFNREMAPLLGAG